MFLRKLTVAILSITVLATGLGNKADASFQAVKASVGRCVPASVPFVNVKKPWKILNKKCDAAKSQDFFQVFSEYQYEVSILLKNVNYNYSLLDVRLEKHLKAFWQTLNKKDGWSVIFNCPLLTDALGYYECNTRLYHFSPLKKEVQYANVSIESFLPGQFSIGRTVFISVKIENGVWS
jgi:hypothetical protein